MLRHGTNTANLECTSSAGKRQPAAALADDLRAIGQQRALAEAGYRSVVIL